mgnify:CR=1 FL=1
MLLVAIICFLDFSMDTGESRGYTGGGGPGLNPCGIDIK